MSIYADIEQSEIAAKLYPGNSFIRKFKFTAFGIGKYRTWDPSMSLAIFYVVKKTSSLCVVLGMILPSKVEL